jgi:hypothetical protein
MLAILQSRQFHPPSPLPPMLTQFHPRRPNVTQAGAPDTRVFAWWGGTSPRLRDQAEGRNPKCKNPALKSRDIKTKKTCGPQAPSPATCCLLQGSQARDNSCGTTSRLWSLHEYRYQTLQTKDESTLACFPAAMTENLRTLYFPARQYKIANNAAERIAVIPTSSSSQKTSLYQGRSIQSAPSSGVTTGCRRRIALPRY